MGGAFRMNDVYDSRKVRCYFEPRDLWVGIYWDRTKLHGWRFAIWRVFVCIVPCFPIRLRFKGP